MPVEARWMGTAHIELHFDGRIVLIDPYITRPSKRSIFIRPLDPDPGAVQSYLDGLEGDVRAVLAGHTHFDHALDIPEVARRTDAMLLGSNSLDTLLSMSGQPGRVTVCRPRERLVLGDRLTVTMIPSMHGLVLSRLLLMEGEIDGARRLPLRVNQYRLGSMFAVKVELGGVTFLHVGSAGFLEEELSGHACDVLFLCAPGWKKWPGYPERLLEIVGPACVVPFHYDDFSLPLVPGADFRTIRSADLEGLTARLKKSRAGMETRFLVPGRKVPF